MKVLRSLILVAIASVLTFPQTPAQKWEFDESGRWIYGKGGSIKEPSYTEEQARLFRQRWAALNTTIKQTEISGREITTFRQCSSGNCGFDGLRNPVSCLSMQIRADLR